MDLAPSMPAFASSMYLFALPLQVETNFDFVSVYFPDTSVPPVDITGNLTDPLPGPFRVVPPNPTGNLIIKFYTDLSGTETGFSLVYQSIPIPPVVGTPSTSPSPVASADSDGTPMSLVVGLAVGLSAAGVAMAGAGLLVWRCRRAGGWLLLAGRGCPMSRLHSHITASPSVVCSCFLWMGLT